MQRAVSAGGRHALLRADGELNSALAVAAQNAIATRTVATLHSVARRFFHRNDHRGGAANTMRLHVALAKALAGEREEAAGNACEALIDDLMVFARSTVGADWPRARPRRRPAFWNPGVGTWRPTGMSARYHIDTSTHSRG